MKQHQGFYDLDFVKQGHKYSVGHYAHRNEIISSTLAKYKPVNVLELCGAEGHLAKLILQKCHTVQEYLFSDFSAVGLGMAHAMLDGLRTNAKVAIRNIDADNIDEIELKSGGLDHYDCYCNTASEHLINDREIVKALSPGTLIYMCLPNFECDGHVRSYRTYQHVLDRWDDIIDIREVIQTENTYGRQIVRRVRSYIQRHRRGALVRFFENLFGCEVIGNKMKFNIIGYRR